MQLFRWKRRQRAFPDQDQDGAQDTSFRNCRGCSATVATRKETAQAKANTARLSKPRGRDGATKKQFLAEEMDTVRLSRPEWRRRDLPDQGEDGMRYQTRVETARFFRPRRRPRNIYCWLYDFCLKGLLKCFSFGFTFLRFLKKYQFTHSFSKVLHLFLIYKFCLDTNKTADKRFFLQE